MILHSDSVAAKKEKASAAVEMKGMTIEAGRSGSGSGSSSGSGSGDSNNNKKEKEKEKEKGRRYDIDPLPGSRM